MGGSPESDIMVAGINCGPAKRWWGRDGVKDLLF